MLGYQELLIIFVLVLLFFGGRKIPEVARGLGKGIREFKKAKDEIAGSLEGVPDADPPEGAEATAASVAAGNYADSDEPVKGKKAKKKKKDGKKKKNKKSSEGL